MIGQVALWPTTAEPSLRLTYAAGTPGVTTHIAQNLLEGVAAAIGGSAGNLWSPLFPTVHERLTRDNGLLARQEWPKGYCFGSTFCCESSFLRMRRSSMKFSPVRAQRREVKTMNMFVSIVQIIPPQE